MKKVLFITIIAFLLTGCVTTQPKVETGQAPAQQEEQLTRTDVAKILMLAINDIEKQGCEAIFLSERGGYIWCRCKDGVVKSYNLMPLIEKYREGKRKAIEKKE